MATTVTIPEQEYKKLRQKAEEFDMIVDKEGLTKAELKFLEEAEKTATLSEKEAKERYKEFFSS